jgi:hypothetical protein
MSIWDKLISGPPGFGSAPLGNMFRNIPEEEAATVYAAWQQGIRAPPVARVSGVTETGTNQAVFRQRYSLPN